jgi:hypothetical protein
MAASQTDDPDSIEAGSSARQGVHESQMLDSDASRWKTLLFERLALRAELTGRGRVQSSSWLEQNLGYERDGWVALLTFSAETGRVIRTDLRDLLGDVV